MAIAQILLFTGVRYARDPRKRWDGASPTAEVISISTLQARKGFDIYADPPERSLHPRPPSLTAWVAEEYRKRFPEPLSATPHTREQQRQERMADLRKFKSHYKGMASDAEWEAAIANAVK